jgi:hypothetical protein
VRVVPIAVRCLVLALVLLAAGCGSSDQPSAPQQAQLCRQLKAATEHLLKQDVHPPAGAARAAVDRACREGFTYAPTAVATPAPASPGCKHLRDNDNPAHALRPRTLSQAAAPVAHFAERPGTLPPDGRPVVGGVRLPAGSRCLHHWATDKTVPDQIGLATKLAAAFPKTGLWPVLWDTYGEDPDSFLAANGELRDADRHDAEQVLRRSWDRLDVQKPPFPALAAGSPGAAEPSAPFLTFAGSLPPTEILSPAGSVLLLVPVNRPADVVSVLGAQLTQFDDDDKLTAVLRSWEERFGAVPVTVGPGTLGLAVAAPPVEKQQALRLAFEQYAFAPGDDSVNGFDDLPRLADRLRSTKPDPNGLRSGGLWRFGWPD